MVSGIKWILNNMRIFCCQVYFIIGLESADKNESGKMSSAEVVCCKYLLTLLTNSQCGPRSACSYQIRYQIGSYRSSLIWAYTVMNKRLLKHIGRRQSQTFLVIGAGPGVLSKGPLMKTRWSSACKTNVDLYTDRPASGFNTYYKSCE